MLREIGKKRKIAVLCIVIFVLGSLIVGCDLDDETSSDGTSQASTQEENAQEENASEETEPEESETEDNTTAESQTQDSAAQEKTDESKVVSLKDIPKYNGSPYVGIYGNKPRFTDKDYRRGTFESYSSLDNLGRCGVTFARIGRDTMPTEKRGSIGMVKPSGWRTIKFDFVDGKYLYNRCHLIGYQLSAENANEKNLITGTRFMNVDGMLPFENMVADYVKETGNHVLYRVTPIFKGNDLVARGVEMEASSVEDKGKALSFHVYVYNVQPGVVINYGSGAARASGTQSSSQTQQSQQTTGQTKQQGDIRGNRRSKIYHCPGQRDYDEMSDSPNLVIFETEAQARKAGYRKAKQ